MEESTPTPSPRIGIVMGSDSDWPIMEKAAATCKQFDLGADVRVLSAHRTPEQTTHWAGGAKERGLQVLVAGAGGAAHLPGVVAACTTLPVIGVPIANGPLSGFDSLLAIVQMPNGIPVATVGVNRADNAALLAVHILALSDPALANALTEFRSNQQAKVLAADERLQASVEPYR